MQCGAAGRSGAMQGRGAEWDCQAHDSTVERGREGEKERRREGSSLLSHTQEVHSSREWSQLY